MMKLRVCKRSNAAFTLFELLAVLAIISVVSSLAVPRVLGTINVTRHQKIENDMKTVARALQRYCIEQEFFSSNICQLGGLGVNGGEWQGSDATNRNRVIHSALGDYINNDISTLDIRIDIDPLNWLTPPGYGCVSVWYPSIDADGNKHFSGNVQVADFDYDSYSMIDWDAYTNSGNTDPIMIICEKDEDEFVVMHSYFVLNSSHDHSIAPFPFNEATEGNDILVGDELDNIIDGLGGNDSINGLAGDDQLYGSSGNDTLTGSSGDDFIDGGANSDTAIFSGSWIFYMMSDNGDGTYTINGADGSDVLTNVEYLQFADRLDLTAIIFDDLQKLILGTEGDDPDLDGGDGSDIIYALGGNDTINGHAGDDVINGGSGIDDRAVFSGSWVEYDISVDEGSTYTISGPDGTDTISSIEMLEFDDRIDTLEAIMIDLANKIVGTPDDDILIGTENYDCLIGLGGNDTISGLAGDDKLYGDAGDDILSGGSGTNQLFGGLGTDTVQYNGSWVYYTIIDNGDNSHTITNSLTDSNDTLEGIENLAFADITGTLTEIKNKLQAIIRGTDNIDNPLNGTAGADIICGYGSNDTIYGLAGNDEIYGGEGSDTAAFNCSWATVTLIANGDGSYTITTIEGTDVLYGIEQLQFIDRSDSIEDIYNDMGNSIMGDNLDNELFGTPGSESILGLGGNDIIHGSGGDDFLDGGVGIDTVIYGDSWTEYLISVGDGDEDYKISYIGSDGEDSLLSVEILQFDDRTGSIFSIYNDILVATKGTIGDDILNGSGIIIGYAGNDNITGSGGNDQIYGGAGTDTVTFVSQSVDANITLNANGSYTIVTLEGTDELYDIEMLEFNDKTDTVENIYAQNGGTIEGTDGNDTLSGTASNDTIYALFGNDIINFSAGTDIIYGGFGDDTLEVNGPSSDFIVIRDSDNPVIRDFLGNRTTLIDVEHIRFTDFTLDLN